MKRLSILCLCAIAGLYAVAQRNSLDYFVTQAISNSPLLKDYNNQVLAFSLDSQIIRAGLQALREQGARGCVLLGDHRYYHRFGFAAAPELSPPQYPAEHFQVARFGECRPKAPVAFHPAFSTGAR